MEKIEELERELGAIKYQVSQIQIGLSRASQVIADVKEEQKRLQQAQMQANMQQQESQLQYQRVQNQMPYRPMQNQPQPHPVNQPVQNPQPVNQFVQTVPNVQNPQPAFRNYAAAKRSSTESWIGKHLMGVLASILIFIALVLFASLIIPYLNDAVKIGMMFTVSIALSGFAFYEHKKRPDNTFFTALLACGLGCSYLSILVTRIYFKAISDVVMYVLLLVWGGVILFMGKKESKLFQAIGNSGYIISAFLAWNMQDKALVLPILIYLIVMGAAFQYNFRKNHVQRIVQSYINLGIIFYFAVKIGSNVEKCVPLTVSAILVVAISAVYFISSIWGEKLKNDANRIVMALTSAIVFFASYLLLADCLEVPKWFSLAAFFAIAAVAEMAAFLQQSEAENDMSLIYKNIWIIAWFAAAEICTYVLYPDFFNTGALFVAILPLAVYGAKKKHDLLRAQALIMAALLAVIELTGELNILFFSVALAYSLIVFVVEAFINKSMYYKIIYYFCVQACMFYLFSTVSDKYTNYNDELKLMYVSIPIGIFNALMRLLKLDRDDKGVSDKLILTGLDIINAMGIAVGLYNIITINGAVLQGINVAFTTALACVNLRRHFAGSSGEKLYAGIKFGVILLFSLIGYDAAGYIVSVATLAFAILCIAIGFNKNFGAKELRIYGLILSMICVVKFIMIDITYENTIGRAISFLISGILCFAISAIYNHFEKQGQNTTVS